MVAAKAAREAANAIAAPEVPTDSSGIALAAGSSAGEAMESTKPEKPFSFVASEGRYVPTPVQPGQSLLAPASAFDPTNPGPLSSRGLPYALEAVMNPGTQSPHSGGNFKKDVVKLDDTPPAAVKMPELASK